jgi:beta-glucuronidase
MLWYQRDFTISRSSGHKTFPHIGAANYKSIAWVNGQEACSHEGGFTAFDCDVSASIHPGKNFVVIAVDNTRLADGVPTLNTDWWNYGGLTRDVSLIDVPAKYIDDYDLHLNRDRTAIEGSVHVEGRGSLVRKSPSPPGVEPQRHRQARAGSAALPSRSLRRRCSVDA